MTTELPHWSALSDADRKMLENLASSFGIKVDDEHEREGELILPNQAESYSIAIEMFMLSRAILGRK